MYKVLFFVILCFLFYQCLPTDEKSKFNEELLNHENLTFFSADAETEVAVRFIREQIFGSTDDVLIGRIGGIAVDAKNRIYIEDARGFTIHIFQPEGSHLVSIGRQGNGPGEFVSPPFPVITSNRLYIYDHMQRRVKIFSTDTFEFTHAINLDLGNQDVINDAYRSYISKLFPRKDGMFIASFKTRIVGNQSHPWYNLKDKHFTRYYLFDNEGSILPDEIFEQRDYSYLIARVRGENKYVPNLFLGKSMITISDEGYIFEASRQDLLIEVRDPEGSYLYSFYYPVEKKNLVYKEALKKYKYLLHPLTTSHVIDSFGLVLQNINPKELPKTWPVVNNIMLDDKNRLWVSVITKNLKKFDVNEWWILEDTGELLAKFTWPRERIIKEIKK